MRTFIVYQQGIGIIPEKTEIVSESDTAAKRQATKLLEVKDGTWKKTTFTDIDGVERDGWTKGRDGWDYGSYPRLYMYENMSEKTFEEFMSEVVMLELSGDMVHVGILLDGERDVPEYAMGQPVKREGKVVGYNIILKPLAIGPPFMMFSSVEDLPKYGLEQTTTDEPLYGKR